MTKTFVIRTYKTFIHVGVGDRKKLKKKIRKITGLKYKGDNNYYARTVRTTSKGRLHLFIFFQNKRPTRGSIAHEAVHACNFIFEYVGHSLDLRNDEAQAYLIERIYDGVEDSL